MYSDMGSIRMATTSSWALKPRTPYLTRSHSSTKSKANLAFCTRSYLAVPKRLYDGAQESVRESLKNRAGQDRIGLLLVTMSRVIEEVRPPSQQFTMKWYEEARKLFSCPYYDNNNEWTPAQYDQFQESFYDKAPKAFDQKASYDWDAEVEDSLTIYKPYSTAVDARIYFGKDKLEAVIYSAEALSSVYEQLVCSRYEMCEHLKRFRRHFESDYRHWYSQCGLEIPPDIVIKDTESGMSVHLGNDLSERVLCSAGGFFRGVLADEPSNLILEIVGNFDRSTWLEQCRHYEKDTLLAIHWLIGRSSGLLQKLIESDAAIQGWT